MKSILKQTRLVLNPYIPPLKLNLLKSMIHDLGGEIVQDWDPDTICITDSLSLPPELESHFDQLKLATSQWIQAIHKHQKIYQLEHFSPDPKMIFSGFIVYGHKLMQENGDLQTLYGGVEAFGGQWRLKFHQDVTHVVAYNDDDELCKDAMRDGIKVILPEYFDDCFRLGQICHDKHYLFPNPGIYKLDLVELLSKSVSRSSTIPVEHNPKFLERQVIYVDPEMVPDTKDQQVLPRWLKNMILFGGKLTTNLMNATIVITDLQSTMYHQAIQASIRVGTRRWMKDQVKQEKMIDPKSAVLYYPRPTKTVPEMERFRISVTNYVGQAREDILKMATHLGATISRTMSTVHTHLICANTVGEKYERALEWNIHIVNHFWIEEIYAAWMYKKEAKPRYLHFSIGLGDMVNRLHVDSLQRTPSVPFVEPVRIEVATNDTPVLDTALQKEAIVESVGLGLEKENVEPMPLKNSTTKEDTVSIESIETPRKRSLDQPSSANKRAKRTLKSTAPCLMFTGIRPSAKQLQSLRQLGFKISDSINSFDLLITNRVATTEKFLISITKGVPIVHERWVDACIKQQKMVDYEDFLLTDDAFDIQKSLQIAIEKPLLKGYTIYFTENILPEPKILKRLVVASGGRPELVNKDNIESKIQEIKEKQDYLMMSNSKDSFLFPQLTKNGIQVYGGEALLNSILRQQILKSPKDLYN